MQINNFRMSFKSINPDKTKETQWTVDKVPSLHFCPTYLVIQKLQHNFHNIGQLTYEGLTYTFCAIAL